MVKSASSSSRLDNANKLEDVLVVELHHHSGLRDSNGLLKMGKQMSKPATTIVQF